MKTNWDLSQILRIQNPKTYSMRLVIVSAFVLLTAIATHSQTEGQPRTCTLKLSQAPAVRGVKLGTMADELFPLFPSGSETTQRIRQSLSAADGYPNFGYSFFGLNLSDTANKEQFAGINNLTVSTFDRRIVSLNVQYDRFPKGARWKDTDELIQRFSDALRLPGPKEWVNDPEQQNRKKLICTGFEAFITGSDQPDIFFINRDWQQLQKDRAAAFDEERRREFKP